MSLKQKLKIKKLEKENKILNNELLEYMVRLSNLDSLKIDILNYKEHIKWLKQENKNLKDELKLAASKLIIRRAK